MPDRRRWHPKQFKQVQREWTAFYRQMEFTFTMNCVYVAIYVSMFLHLCFIGFTFIAAITLRLRCSAEREHEELH